jgi:DNA-binding SARP family transcriptional activator
VRVEVGDRLVDGSQVRRKVLALLTLLLTKPRFSASREDVTESLWPDLDPSDALNSLNQTVYFLRRLFEPGYREDLTPGFVHQDGEMIWLDSELVVSRSSACRQLIGSCSTNPSISQALSIVDLYEAPFALDFAYEEWASRFRDPLHASVLRVVEQALRGATDASDLRAGVGLAERTLVLEPDADEIQLALIQLYRITGAHAAAAEHRERYAASLRSLGIDEPPAAD